jgi:hypothetical protein
MVEQMLRPQCHAAFWAATPEPTKCPRTRFHGSTCPRSPTARAWCSPRRDIFPETIVPEGTTGTITENGLNELGCDCIVTPDDAALRTALAQWDGAIWLSPPLDRGTGNREPDWQGASPIALL